MKKQQTIKKLVVIFLIVSVTIGGYIYYYNSRLIDIIDEEIAMSGSIGVTPQMFGAKGDGKTNDTRAVQAAIDYASKSDKNNIVFIPEGIYSVIRLKLKKNVQLIGSGEKSILLADPSAKTWNGILACHDLNSVNIREITFDGNKPIVEGNHEEGTVNIWITNCNDVNISNCVFQNNWYLGICLQNSNNITIENNKFINLDCGIITTDKPSSNILIKGNYFDGAEWSEPVSIYGLKEGYHNNITIIDNVMKNHTKGSGILLRAVKSVLVKNNTIDNCGTGIYCSFSEYNGTKYGVYDATIEDNIITNSVYEGILLKNINDSTVQNNIVENSKSYGLLTLYVDKTTISNNTFIEDLSYEKSFHGFAMTIAGMENSIVSNNIIDIKGEINKYRSPIYLGTVSGSKSLSHNNTFSDNKITSDVINIYREDANYVQNNIYATN